MVRLFSESLVSLARFKALSLFTQQATQTRYISFMIMIIIIILLAVQQYYSVSDIHDALVQREVKGALIDTYVVAAKAQMFTDEGIRVAKMLERAFGYGVALSSGISALETECLQYLKVNAEKMTRLIDQSTSKLTVS